MRVFDCFPFFNELDVLEMRLHELEDVVDVFVAVEATKTFRLTPKPLYLKQALENTDRFNRWRSKLVVSTFIGMPDQLVPEERMYEIEGLQRNHIDVVLESPLYAKPDDLILISDVDEIPKAMAVGAYRDYGVMEQRKGKWPAVKLEQDLYYYALNVRFPHHQVNGQPWYGTRMMPYGLYSALGGMRARLLECLPWSAGGWHFSFFGGEEVMLEKVRGWSHASAFIPEPLNPEAYMREARDKAQDWDPKRKAKLDIVPVLPETHPAWVVENLPKLWKHMAGPERWLLKDIWEDQQIASANTRELVAKHFEENGD